MNPSLYCLNTSTIKPTPLLEKFEIAGRLGYGALEPWNDEITEYLGRGGAGAGRAQPDQARPRGGRGRGRGEAGLWGARARERRDPGVSGAGGDARRPREGGR